MIRRLLNAPGKWVTSSLALAARFSGAGRKSITRHRQWGLVAERRRGCGGYNAAAGGGGGGNETSRDGVVEDREGGGEGATRRGSAAGQGGIKAGAWNEAET